MGEAISEVRSDDSGRTKAFRKLADSHRDAMRLLREFGVLGKSAVGRLKGQDRTFRNIGEHCLVVGMVADVILEKFVSAGYLTASERETGVKAALLHDLTKRQELEIEKGIEANSPRQFLSPNRRRVFIGDLFKEHQVSEGDVEVIKLAGLSGDGVLGLPESPIAITGSPNELIRWIIFLADYMVAHTTIVSPQERFREADERGGYHELARWWYKNLYGEPALESASASDIGQRLRDKTLFFLKQAEEQCKTALGVSGDMSLHDYVEREIQKRYAAQE